MAFCPKCGKEIPEEVTVCPECGADFSVKAEAKTEEKKGFKKLLDTRDTTADYEGESKNKFFAIISYISILFLIPMFCAKNQKWVQYHVQQGMLLFVANAVLSAVLNIALGWIPVVGSILNYLLVYLPTLALMVFGIIMAIKGKAKELPIIGSFRITKE